MYANLYAESFFKALQEEITLRLEWDDFCVQTFRLNDVRDMCNSTSNYEPTLHIVP